MAKKKSNYQGPQTAVARASYELSQRNTKVWQPMLRQKIETLRAHIREKQLPAGSTGG